MKIVVQRVLQANVSVEGIVVNSIGRGLCVLVGISRHDTTKDADYIVRKLLNLRVFEDENGKRWNRSVKDNNYQILCVSQFTLYSKLKGNKPDFHLAMPPDLSETFYHNFLTKLKGAYNPDLIKDGKFGAYMQLSIENDGPVTIEIESPGAAHLDSISSKESKTEELSST